MSQPLNTPDPIQQLVSIEAEEAVLGSLLMDPDAISRVSTILKPGDFYREKHAWIYASLLRLDARDEPPDTLLVSSDLAHQGQLDAVGGPAALTELFMRVPTAIHADYYARQVERAATLRRLVGVAQQIATMAYSPDAHSADIATIFAKSEALLAGVFAGRNRSDPHHISGPLNEILDELERLRVSGETPGMPSSLTDLQDLVGGYHRGEQTVLAARPAVGKSSLAAQEAWHLARLGYTVLVTSLEMSRWSVSRRLMARAGGVSLRHLRDGLGPRASDEAWADFQAQAATAAGQLGELPLYIDDEPGQSAHQIRAKAKALRARLGKLDFLIVDYLGLIHHDRSGKQRQDTLIGDDAMLLRETARELGCHNLLLHQLNREAAHGPPALHHMADSGWIERNADMVFAIYDPVMAGAEEADDDAAYASKQVYVLKQRNGPTGYVDVLFDGATQAWKDEAPDYIQAQEKHMPPPPPPQRRPYQGQPQANRNGQPRNGTHATTANQSLDAIVF